MNMQPIKDEICELLDLPITTASLTIDQFLVAVRDGIRDGCDNCTFKYDDGCESL